MNTKTQTATSKSKKASVKRGAARKPSKSIEAAKATPKPSVIVIPRSKRGRVLDVKAAAKVKGLEPVKFDSTALKGSALAKGTKKKAATPGGASSTAPVVYQTLRERVAAVEKNIGQKQTLKEFLDSVGWK